jgi:fibro-slime domain-containing protein
MLVVPSPGRRALRPHAYALLLLSACTACASPDEDADQRDASVAGEGGSDAGDDGSPGLDGSSDPGPDADGPAPEGCGDGDRPDGSLEECDDGNDSSGDGCDARCRVEPGYLCAQQGGGCAPVCGDGLVVASEQCDDANSAGGDGCSQMCGAEEGFACPVPGEACTAARCGDGLTVAAEACDDGNGIPGDGCSASCTVETGWLCSGMTCAAAGCGDGARAGSETCDDGNTASGDGCNADCSAREPFFACPVLGGACTRTTVCGDGVFTADESCDDANVRDGDGCSARCTVENGFSCPGGLSCQTTCGDGVMAGEEQCDDGDAEGGDGCTASCALEPGYHCPTPNAACVPAVCGNGVAEGLEQCDDGALVTGVAVPDHELGDGCTPACTREPSCGDGMCVATCGDGIVAPTEACDDGNRRNFDGCNADCSAIEPGFQCTAVTATPDTCIDLPLVLRDFKSFGTPGRHPDFNDKLGSESGIVRDRLGVDANNDGVADLNPPAGSALSVVYAKQGASSSTTSGATNFNDWYHDTARSKTVVSRLRVCDNNHTGSYVFDNGSFFPLDGKGWQDPSVPSGNREQNGSNGHNFGFTSEVRFWFTFKGTEVLSFRGDDDVWVFINNRLAVDLGGVHTAETQTLTFRPDGSASSAGDRFNGTVQLGLTVGRVYEAVVFQAERHESLSSYKLTLGNFISAKSVCTGVCGDGVRTVGEVCDDGKACSGGDHDGEVCSSDTDCSGGSCATRNVNGQYGHCNATCSGLNAHCGDGQVDLGHEACDLGAVHNDGAYGGCNPNCTLGPRCGDANVDSFGGETCDQGASNADGVYNACSTTCRVQARCGDGVTQTDQGEDCDDGFNRSVYGGCAPGCTLAPYCGDGVLQSTAREMCDLGADLNAGQYGGCDPSCSLAAFCGDGRVDEDAGEQCDDGNANDYDGCSAKCEDETILR